MKLKNGLLVGTTILSVLFSCAKHTQTLSIVTKFEETGKLTADIQKIPVSILLPRAIFISGDKLLVYKEKEEHLFDVFKLPECTYLFSSSRRGQGPDDFLLLDTRSFQVSGNEFKVMDTGNNKYKTVSVENDQLNVINSKMFPNYRFVNGFYLLADSVYLTLDNAGGKNEYGLYDDRKALLTETGNYPQWTALKAENPNQQMFTYIKNCVVHPDGKKFAAFYGKFKRWRIYDHSASLLHDVDVKIPPYDKDADTDLGNGWEYYIGQPQAINNYIYALCANSKSKQSDNSGVCELQVWDWNGNPIACFSLDRRISMFAISEKYNKIYALDRSIDDELYIYDLPQLKNNKQ